ncbi:MAG: trehalose-phosphatase [Solirubrobacteraceae bacterium]
MPTAATLAETLAPLRADQRRSAVLLDIDGTLAPIVPRAQDAAVPAATRSLLVALAGRYRMVACISGRPAAVARSIVGIDSISYVGNHGCERLDPGSDEVELDSEIAPWTLGIRDFARTEETAELAALGIRGEDKGPIAGFHWRGASDEEAALAAVKGIEGRALAADFHVHWGRKVLEVRPPLQIDKGRGVAGLLTPPAGVAHGLYMGDDVTDIDAFDGLRAALGDGAVCVGVRSEETPDELARAADVMVDGELGVREVLQALLD